MRGTEVTGHVSVVARFHSAETRGDTDEGKGLDPRDLPARGDWLDVRAGRSGVAVRTDLPGRSDATARGRRTRVRASVVSGRGLNRPALASDPERSVTAPTMPAPRVRQRVPLCDRDPSDPVRQAVELAQRGRMILDVSAADLEAAEAALGPFHPTAWYFRTARDEARRAWDRLRAQYGSAALDAALQELPLTYLTLERGSGREPVVLIPVGGHSYRAERVVGTALAPIQWRLTRLHPPLEDGPYFACRLHDGSVQCDCAEWVFEVADSGRHACKHLAALRALGWL